MPSGAQALPTRSNNSRTQALRRARYDAASGPSSPSIMKRNALLLLACTALVLPAAAATFWRPEDEQEAREEAFAELLTGARLTGWFSDDTHPDAAPAKDSYVISRCEKADDGKWLFESVVGETGLKVPLYLPVEWAGDTPVITLDQFPVPQMGTFDARVLFHGQSYAGTWRGEKHGGEMMGHIERVATEAGAKK